MGEKEPNPLLYGQNFENEGLPYDKKSIHNWALVGFPRTFSALPDVDSLNFTPMDKQKAANTKCGWPEGTRTILLLVGTYDCTTAGGCVDYVYAYVHSKRANTISFLRDCSSSPSYQNYKALDTEEQRKTKFAQPFCDIAERRWSSGTKMRFRAVTCYYYMMAGYISRVGGYQTYPQDLYMACAWIASGVSQPNTAPSDMTSEPKVCKRTVSCLSVDIKSKAGEFLNDFTRMSTDVNTKRKAPAEEIAARTKAASASAIDLMIADHNIISQAEKHEKALRQLNQVLDKAQKDCQEMVQGNKRLKLDVKSTRDKDNEFRAANNTLTCENQKLRTNLEAEKKQNANLREVLDRVSEEARKEFATQLQQEKTKAVKAEAEREQETKVAKDLRKQLDTMTAQLEKKDVKAASQVVKEKKRADEAEAKLATIQAVFGRTI